MRGLSGLYAMQRLTLFGGDDLSWKLGQSGNIARRRTEYAEPMRVAYVCPAPREELRALERTLLECCPFRLGSGWGREWLRADEAALWQWLQSEVYP